MPILASILWGLVVVAAVGVFFYFYQPRMLYFPSAEIVATPTQIGLKYEEVFFNTIDGGRISAWFVPAAPARGTALLCHGNGGNISHRMHAIKLFHDLGLNVFIFDYRGYGMSSGTPSETGTYRDALGAWNYLRRTRGLPTESIVIVGRSLGGAVAAWLAENQTPGALVLEAAFTSVPDIGARLYPYLPVRLLSRFSYNTLERMDKINCPILVAHSPDDEMIPFEHGRRLFQAAREPKLFCELTGSHNEGEDFTPDDFRRKLDGFISAHLRRPAR